MSQTVYGIDTWRSHPTSGGNILLLSSVSIDNVCIHMYVIVCAYIYIYICMYTHDMHIDASLQAITALQQPVIMVLALIASNLGRQVQSYIFYKHHDQ